MTTANLGAHYGAGVFSRVYQLSSTRRRVSTTVNTQWRLLPSSNQRCWTRKIYQSAAQCGIDEVYRRTASRRSPIDGTMTNAELRGPARKAFAQAMSLQGQWFRPNQQYPFYDRGFSNTSRHDTLTLLRILSITGTLVLPGEQRAHRAKSPLPRPVSTRLPCSSHGNQTDRLVPRQHPDDYRTTAAMPRPFYGW